MAESEKRSKSRADRADVIALAVLSLPLVLFVGLMMEVFYVLYVLIRW